MNKNKKMGLEMVTKNNPVYAYIDLVFCAVDENDKVRPLSTSNPYAGLVISNKIDKRKKGTTYDWVIAYQNVPQVDLHWVKVMHKTLKTIRTKLEAFDKEWGMTNSYGEWVLRVMKATRATMLIDQGRLTEDPIDIRYTLEVTCKDLINDLL